MRTDSNGGRLVEQFLLLRGCNIGSLDTLERMEAH